MTLPTKEKSVVISIREEIDTTQNWKCFRQEEERSEKMFNTALREILFFKPSDKDFLPENGYVMSHGLAGGARVK